jgi:hypothetical protein
MNPATSPEWRRAQWSVEAPTLRSRDEQAPLEHRLGQFLYKERHPIGLGDDLRHHFRRQWPAGDVLGQGLGLGGR